LVGSGCPGRLANGGNPHKLGATPGTNALASSRDGVNEDLLIRGHGFSRAVLASLVRRRLLAARAREVAMAGGKAIEVVRIRITAEGDRRRLALKLLASSRHGANEELLGYGFSRRMLAGLVQSGLAAAEREVVKAGSKAIEVSRIRIAKAGRRAVED
jgi:hypothetical protein